MSTTETKAAPKKREVKVAPKKRVIKAKPPIKNSRSAVQAMCDFLGITAFIDSRITEALKAKKAKVPKPVAMRGQRPPKAPPVVAKKTEPTGDEQL